MPTVIARFVRDDGGATAVEYALVAGFLSIVLLASIFSLGGNLTALWQHVANATATP